IYAYPRAEARLRSWAQSHAQAFARGLQVQLDARELLAGLTQRTRAAELKRILLLAASRRRGARMVAERLAKSAAFLQLGAGSFAELGTPHVWRGVVAGCRSLAARVPAYRVTMPQGVVALESALKKNRRQSRTSRS